MNTLFTKATLGIALGAATLTAAVPADAQRYRYRDRDNTGAAVVAGIAGLAIGAALTSGDRYDRGYRGYDRRYDRDRRYYRQRGFYPNDGYYARNHYRNSGYNRCAVRRVYDPYLGRSVRVRYC